MWRAIICLCAALTLGLPAVCHAQYYGNDRQHPKQYTNDDSQPMRLGAYVLSPLGFMLEWSVTRPLHYVATDTFLAPVFGGEKNVRPYVAPFPPLPPEAGSVEPTQATKLPPSQVSESGTPAPPAATGSTSPAVSKPSSSSSGKHQPQQPIVH